MHIWITKNMYLISDYDCGCQNGKVSTSSQYYKLCTQPGQNACESCDEQYTLSDGNCIGKYLIFNHSSSFLSMKT